jgi:A-macroglobulin TED domain/Alpha-2-macroglobulin family/Carboxypeptidase regulatory-like domain/MG2 domain/A-macroglobulin receptor binding domain/Alpha-2-macroglobulin bait region domain
MQTRRYTVLLQRLLLLSLALLLLAAAYPRRSEAHSTTATFTHGVLSVSIPYQSTRQGSGMLLAEILDPEDHVVGRAERAVAITKGDGAWQQTIAPAKPIAFEDIVWQRVRYRFQYDDANVPAITGVEAITRILRRPVVHILGQTEYFAGSDASIRVLVSDGSTGNGALSGAVRAELLVPQQKARPLFSARLNNRGTVAAQFRFPAGVAGKYAIRLIADTPIGSTEYTQPVLLKDAASILLTTEKPIYQPGQSIHIRALALDGASHRADARRSLTFELEDSRGNKVFKKKTVTDDFGVASAGFSLADEVNLGTYHLRALLGEKELTHSEVAINVERYVLPKFKIAVEFTGKDNRPRRDYRPGDHVSGTVRANYFFGKPVDHAEIALKISSMDVDVFVAASAKGRTDNQGAYHFDLALPTYFAGRSANHGAARALVEATIKDSAGHSETRGEPITISQSSLLVVAVPEGGTLIPHLANQIFLISSYPDGTPASTSLTVHTSASSEQHVSTDSSGIATIHLVPGSAKESMRVDADDHRGNHATMAVPLLTREGDDQVLLHVNRAVVKAGEQLDLSLLATRAGGAVYVDVVKNGQTILTRDLDLHKGQAGLSLTVTPEMAGTLDLNAYLFGRDAQPVADHRLVFVQPADELKIETTTDAAVYKPGADARIHFRVTNAHGEGVSAALGLQVVDEAVFALAEKQPGFAKTFFYLEQEVMKPHYEIHSLSLADAIVPVEGATSEKQDTEARALFAATEMAMPARLDIEFGQSLPQDRYAAYQERYQSAFAEQIRNLTALLNDELGKHATDITPTFRRLADNSHLHDAWGRPLRFDHNRLWGNHPLYSIRSAGPDGQFDSRDDLVVYLETATQGIAGEPGLSATFDLKIEHDHGPFNERAEVNGAVHDASGAVVPGATVVLHQNGTGKTLRTHTDPDGQFALTALAPGKYRAEITSPGFEDLVTSFTLAARDRASLDATLWVGSVSQTVTVSTAMPAVPLVRVVNRGVMGGILGGIGGPADALMAPASADVQGRSLTMAVKTRSQEPAAHVRSYFPETLYINPEIITDAHGNASVTIPVADSITTWRMAMLASTASGALGSATSGLKVFQDFFVDLDLPVTLTQGDQISLPVAVYNYSDKAGKVGLKLQPEDWFSLENDTAEKSVAAEPDRVGASQFTLTAKRIGKFKLTLRAHKQGAASRDDIVVREIEVIPNGREQDTAANGRLEKSAAHDLHFPDGAIADASSIVVRLYPGPLSQIIEGMDSILTMPGGCFEQTSSSTYPNVLALDYMKRTKKLTPETHAKAEGYIANGYQRLLTFEVPGGGFSWFGQAPANKILTAYGLMEFNDMAQVSEVDPKVIARTREWLLNQQQGDGNWAPDTSFINEGATTRYNSNVLRITAYIAWALVNTGMQGPAIDKARNYIDKHLNATVDPYTLAVIANFAADDNHDRAFTDRAMQLLLDARNEQGDQVSWRSEETPVYATGSSAAIETTGLATQALLKWGRSSETVRKTLNFITARKEASGAWGTTQATIMALRALIQATQLSASGVRGRVQIMVDGKQVEALNLTAENDDLLHQFVFKNIDARQTASVQLHFDGTGSLAYQVVGRSFVPWDQQRTPEPLSINVAYDRTRLQENDIATETVTVRNNLPKTANMIMADLGIPPGFDLLSEDLSAFQEKTAGTGAGRLEKFTQTATQAILYFNGLAPHQEVTLKIRLRAKYPVRAHTFQSRLYEYYDPSVSSTARPVKLEVVKR